MPSCVRRNTQKTDAIHGQSQLELSTVASWAIDSLSVFCALNQEQVLGNTLLGSEREHSQFDSETMSTNKIVCQLCAEFIPATRATGQNHRLTVGPQGILCLRRTYATLRANCVLGKQTRQEIFAQVESINVMPVHASWTSDEGLHSAVWTARCDAWLRPAWSPALLQGAV